MKKARYTTGIVILILLASIVPWPMGEAIVPQDQTISIIDTHDDAFITESGNLIDTYLCHITDPNMDITSFLVFRELDINFWEPLTNATLRFRTTVNQDFDADSSVTIYGMKIKNLQDEGIIRTSFVLSVPKTSAYVNVNTSQFYGQQWHEVDVTNIIQELKSSIHWDGHGRSADETGDDVGFIIYGAEGHDTRWFIDYYYGTPDLASQLVIHWNHEFSPPSGYEDAEFVETYGDNYTIWEMPGALGYPLEPIEYVFGNETYTPDTSINYDNLTGEGPYFVNTSYVSYPTALTSQRRLVRTSNGTLYSVYPSLNPISRSADNGMTWTMEPVALMTAKPAIAVDSKDFLHVVWTDPDPWQVYYSYRNITWSEPLDISPEAGNQLEPSIAIDSNDYIHVLWVGPSSEYPTQNQVWYSNYTDSWSTPYRVNDVTTSSSSHPSIAIDSEDNLHIAWVRLANIRYRNRTESWQDVIFISNAPGMAGTNSDPSIAVDSLDVPYVCWEGKSDEFPSYNQIWVKNATDGWDSPIRVSTYSSMDDYGQRYPNVALDSNDTIYVIWQGNIVGAGADEQGWLANYTDTWNEPYQVQVGGELTYFSLRWARWPEVGPSTFFIVDKNGTVVMDNGNTINSTDIQDIYDWIDIEDPDPEDPDPAGDWSDYPGGLTGAFTRFRMRLWFLLIGFGCLFGPILFFAWRRPSGYYIMCGAIVMLIGIGLIISIGQV